MKEPLAERQLQERRKLLEMLRGFLRRGYGYDALYEKFYFYYVDLPDDLLSEGDLDFFGAIHEKMDFVAENPDTVSRRVGWISAEEFRSWLNSFLASQSMTDEPRSPAGHAGQ